MINPWVLLSEEEKESLFWDRLYLISIEFIKGPSIISTDLKNIAWDIYYNPFEEKFRLKETSIYPVFNEWYECAGYIAQIRADFGYCSERICVENIDYIQLKDENNNYLMFNKDNILVE